MPDTISLTLTHRTIHGKKVKRLRLEGIVPVHLYGRGFQSQSLQCDSRILVGVLTRAGMNLPVSVTIPSQEEPELTFIRDIQWDNLRGSIIHVDFLRVDASQEVTASVPITLIGSAPVSRLLDGSIVQSMRDLVVRALPLEMPSSLSAKLDTLAGPDDVIHASDILLPPSVSLITDPEATVARFELAREEPDTVVEEEDTLGLGGDETPGTESSPDAST